MSKARKRPIHMGQDRNDLREKVTGKAGELAAKAEAKAGEMGLSRQHVAAVKDEVRAKGEKAVGSSVEGARQVAAGARRNKARVAIAAVAAAFMAVVLAGRRIVRRRKS
jgi:hypothetical protein